MNNSPNTLGAGGDGNTQFNDPPPAQPTQREPLVRGKKHGRVIAGVASALAARAGSPVWAVRGAFAVATLFFGIGAIAYLVGWIVIPSDDTGDRSVDVFRVLAGAALAVTCGLILVGLMIASGVLSLFGLGGVALSAMAATLVITALAWPRVRPVLAIGIALAIVLPMVAVAASGVRLDRNLSGVFAVPESVSKIPADGYSTGIGTTFVDLRKTHFRTRTVTELPIRSGTGLVVVALPHDRCVKVRLTHHYREWVARRNYSQYDRSTHISTRWRDLSWFDAGLNNSPLRQYSDEQLGRTNLFDRTAYGPVTSLSETSGPADAPRLEINVRSLASPVFVRDYPDSTGPLDQPTWPNAGNLNPPASPGDLRYAWRLRKIKSTPGLANRWHKWQGEMRAYQAKTDALGNGPCSTGEGK